MLLHAIQHLQEGETVPDNHLQHSMQSLRYSGAGTAFAVLKKRGKPHTSHWQ
jgi:hypothetical protein